MQISYKSCSYAPIVLKKKAYGNSGFVKPDQNLLGWYVEEVYRQE